MAAGAEAEEAEEAEEVAGAEQVHRPLVLQTYDSGQP